MNLYLAESGGAMKAYLRQTDRQTDGSDDYCESIVREHFHTKRCGEGDRFKGTNILQSFYYCDDFTESVIIPNCKNFMLDSGAFTFFSTGGGGVDWSSYIKKYANFINRNKVNLFFELDIDNLIGYDKVLYYRKKLEDMTGKPCIPVWHVSRGKEEFLRMCEQYDYVAFGGLNTDGVSRQKIVKYMPWFIDMAHANGAKIHGLGFTALKELPRIHFDSVDSTAWVSGNRFGSVYEFNGTTMVKHDRKEGQRLANSKAVAIHNFNEWVKFAKYAEKYL